MQNLSPRHVQTEESLRLGVVSGWYSTKVSGTFVTGPHTTQGGLPFEDRRAQSAARQEEVLDGRFGPSFNREFRYGADAR